MTTAPPPANGGRQNTLVSDHDCVQSSSLTTTAGVFYILCAIFDVLFPPFGLIGANFVPQCVAPLWEPLFLSGLVMSREGLLSVAFKRYNVLRRYCVSLDDGWHCYDKSRKSLADFRRRCLVRFCLDLPPRYGASLRTTLLIYLFWTPIGARPFNTLSAFRAV